MQTETPNTPNQNDIDPTDASQNGQPDPTVSDGVSRNGTSTMEVSKLERELADFKDKYIRAHAEMENMRRRQERERSDLIKYGLEAIFKDLLPVLDSFEKALPGEEGGSERFADPTRIVAFADGMVMVRKQLLEVCRRHGLEPIDARDAPFDPNLHQAIQRLDSSDVEVDTVGCEYARGYQLHGRLLRPAMVSVLTPSGG